MKMPDFCCFRIAAMMQIECRSVMLFCPADSEKYTWYLPILTP